MDRLQVRCPWISLSLSWCCLCHESNESIHHLLLHCKFTRFVWNEIYASLITLSMPLKKLFGLLSFMRWYQRFGKRGVLGSSKIHPSPQMKCLNYLFSMQSFGVKIYFPSKITTDLFLLQIGTTFCIPNFLLYPLGLFYSSMKSFLKKSSNLNAVCKGSDFLSWLVACERITHCTF